MSLTLRKAFGRLPFCHRKAANEDLKLTKNPRDSPTPAAAVKALEFELSEERTKFLRLEQEYQRAKTELNTLTGAKRDLDAEMWETRGLLAAREKELGKTQAKVGRAGRGTNSKS
jgi:hypothetical protein